MSLFNIQLIYLIICLLSSDIIISLMHKKYNIYAFKVIYKSKLSLVPNIPENHYKVM